MNGLPRVLAAGTFVVAALTGVAWAQHLLPERQISRGQVNTVRPFPMESSKHAVYGSIARIAGDRLVLHTRTNRLIAVDWTAAMRRGTYSAPLFIGKLVVVHGNYDRLHVLHASTVTRLVRIDAFTHPDF